jgi:MFS superfamily sulfate permease-like transporter
MKTSLTIGFQVLFGWLRLGRYVNLMPYPVISGFLTGVGTILIIMQLEPLLGYPAHGSVVNALSVLPAELTAPQWQAVLVKDMAEVQMEAMRTINDPAHERLFDEATAALYHAHRKDLLFLHLSGLISFGAASEMTRGFSRVSEYKVLIIDLLDVPRIDVSAALALEEMIQRANEDGKPVIITGMTYHVTRLLGRLGSLDLVRESERFDTRPEAIRAAVAHLQAVGVSEPSQ